MIVAGNKLSLGDYLTMTIVTIFGFAIQQIPCLFCPWEWLLRNTYSDKSHARYFPAMYSNNGNIYGICQHGNDEYVPAVPRITCLGRYWLVCNIP